MKFLYPLENLFKNLFNGRYNYSFNLINNVVEFNRYYEDKEKLTAALTNPALLKVFGLQCDLFSLAEVYLKDKDGNYIEKHPFLDWIENPNPVQTKKQFLWDYMFWTMLGNSYLYIDSRNLNMPNNSGYFLTPYKIDFPEHLDQDRDKLIMSSAKTKAILETPIKYYYDDGTSITMPLSKILISNDLTNGVGNYYKGASRIDALYKIISNSEHSLDSKNINVRYTAKFMVSSDGGADKLPLTKEEKESVQDKMNSDGKQVYPMSAMAKIQRFVEDYSKLRLEESYLQDFFLIGNMYNIPRDVLEAYQSSTYENQEKARGSHVSYTLSPKGDELANQFNKYFRLKEEGLKVCFDWSYLPFMQVFEGDRAETMNSKADAMQKLVNLGYSLDDAQQLVDL